MGVGGDAARGPPLRSPSTLPRREDDTVDDLSRTPVDASPELLRQQSVLARFGELALRCEDLDEILGEACRLVGEALCTELAKVLELSPDGLSLRVRAGVGWTAGVVGHVSIPLSDATSEGHTVRTGSPTISPDIDAETRFRYPDVLIAHGVRAVANVVILGAKGRAPFGVLQVESRVERQFTDNDTAFLKSYANLIAAAVDRITTIAALRDTQARLQRGLDQQEVALETGLIGFFEWDGEAALLKGDRRLAAFFGLAPEEVSRGLPLDRYIARVHPDDRGTVRTTDRDVLVAEDYVKQLRTLLPDGTLHWLLVRGRMTSRPGTRSVRLAGTAVDISASKAADQRLRQTEQRFRGFAENSADTLWITDAAAEKLDYLSPAFTPMFGEAQEAVLSDLRRWRDLVHPADRDAALRGIARVSAGEATAIEHYRVIRPVDGAMRWIRDTAFAIRDEHGVLQHVAGVSQDISDIAQAQAELTDSERRFRTLVEGVPLFVWRSGSAGCMWTTRQWEDYTGQTMRESLGWGWLEAVHPDDREPVLASCLASQPAGGLAVDHRIRRASDGTYRWHQARCVPVHGPAIGDGTVGPIVGWLGTTSDIDDLKRLQGQQQVLLAELQHRTRNLLAVVRSIANRSFAHRPERREFDTRLAAIGRVQGFLSRNRGWSVVIGELIRAELDAHRAESMARVVLEGPDVELPGDIAQPFALAVHELATNAVKYGAFATSSGRLDVRWWVAGPRDDARLVLDWRESGVAIMAQPERMGYGRELIERALPYQLRAETRLAFTPDGVHCALSVPLGGSQPEGQ